MNKQIEETAKEMAKELCGYYDKQKRKCTNCFGMEEDCDLHCNFGRTLERLSNAGYQKVDKDKQVVLSREEYDNLKLEIQKALHKGIRLGFDLTKYKENSIEQARKETATEIFKALYSMRDVYAEHYEYEIRLNEYNLQELAKQYGVEVDNERNKI